MAEALSRELVTAFTHAALKSERNEIVIINHEIDDINVLFDAFWDFANKEDLVNDNWSVLVNRKLYKISTIFGEPPVTEESSVPYQQISEDSPYISVVNQYDMKVLVSVWSCLSDAFPKSFNGFRITVENETPAISWIAGPSEEDVEYVLLDHGIENYVVQQVDDMPKSAGDIVSIIIVGALSIGAYHLGKFLVKNVGKRRFA